MKNSLNDMPVHHASIDLNADLGEGFPNDRALLELVTSASICCGAHAATHEEIRQTLVDAVACGVVVGAHPGYADREHFGRREREMDSDAVRDLILEQVAALIKLAAEAGAAVRFVKPHGALYNQAQREEGIARGVVAAAIELDLPLLGQPDTLLRTQANIQKVRYITEGFPDRRYRPDGSLTPRSEADAILCDPGEFEAQVLRLVNEGSVETLCVHGDEAHAVANAELVRRVLKRSGIVLRSFVHVAN
jgi:UPF0271 protein